jgi:hypothetical protein
VREAVIAPKDRATTDLVDAARDRIGRAIFTDARIAALIESRMAARQQPQL